MKKIKKGFTLSEVLITLAIIGIVAALTIPAVINYAFERQAVSGAKATYALLSQAIALWQLEENCVGNSTQCPEIGPSVWGGAYPHQENNIAKNIAKYLKVVDTGGDVGAWPIDLNLSIKDWIPEDSYGLDGRKCAAGCSDYDTGLFINKGSATNNTGSYLLLSNGVIVSITGNSWKYNIVFDINGAKKPNRMGKDVFAMSLYTPNYKTANPYNINQGAGWNPFYGVCVDTAAVKCNPDDGASPLAYVLKHNKLPDLKSLGFPTSP